MENNLRLKLLAQAEQLRKLLVGNAEQLRLWLLLRENNPCPERKGSDYCRLNDSSCIDDKGYYCNTYEDWLFELKQEEVDNLGKEKLGA